MEELMRFLKSGIAAIIIMAGLVGFINWRSVKNTYWRYFPFYLISVAGIEILRVKFMNIEFIYSFLTIVITPIEFLFFFWLFAKNNQKKLPIIIGCIIYLIIFLVETVWIDTLKSDYFMSFSYSIGNVILLIFILQYFYKLIYSDRILYFHYERMFWVSLGLLIFFLGTLPYFGLYNLMLSKYFDLLVSYTWLEIFLNYVMYSLFAASFIWGGKEK